MPVSNDVCYQCMQSIHSFIVSTHYLIHSSTHSSTHSSSAGSSHMRFNFDHIVYSYYNNKLLTTLEKIYTPRIQEVPLILYDARHVYELAILIRSEDSNHASMFLTYSCEDRIPDWSLGYLTTIGLLVTSSITLSMVLH